MDLQQTHQMDLRKSRVDSTLVGGDDGRLTRPIPRDRTADHPRGVSIIGQPPRDETRGPGW